MPQHEIPMLAPSQCPACGSTGALTVFNGNLPLASSMQTVDVSNLYGEQCALCQEVFLDGDSQSRFLAVADDLVLKARNSVG